MIITEQALQRIRKLAERPVAGAFIGCRFVPLLADIAATGPDDKYVALNPSRKVGKLKHLFTHRGVAQPG